MADILSLLRQAIVAIANGDAIPTVGLQALAGRTAEIIVTWEDLRLDGPFPVIAYALAGFSQTGQNDDTREGTLKLSAFAEGNGALALAESIVGRCEDLFLAPAFLIQGLDAAPLILARDYRGGNTGDELDAGPREGSRNTQRADLDIELTICRAA